MKTTATIYKLRRQTRMKSNVYRFGTKVKATVWLQKINLIVYKFESKLIVYRFGVNMTATGQTK